VVARRRGCHYGAIHVVATTTLDCARLAISKYDEPRKGRKIISIEVVVDEFRGWWSMGWSYKAQRYFCDFLTKKRRPIF